MDTNILFLNKETDTWFVIDYFQLDTGWNPVGLGHLDIFLERHNIHNEREFRREIRYAAYKYECDHGMSDCEYAEECALLHVTPDELEALYDQHEDAVRYETTR